MSQDIKSPIQLGWTLLGVADSIAFGHADLVYGQNSATMNRGTGLNFAGLGVGIAGQLFMGNWAAGVMAEKNGKKRDRQVLVQFS